MILQQLQRRMCALAIGLEDYTADIGTQRTLEGKESLFARAMLLNAAKAAGIQAIDTVFSDVNDMEGLRQSVEELSRLALKVRDVYTRDRYKLYTKHLLPLLKK
jgi:citrate lyase beta subunit